MTQRPIKFRYVYQGKVVDVGAIEFFEDGTFRVNDELVGGTLIESTGLHDKNGKEIWEGDIVTVADLYFDDEGKRQTRHVPGEVKWHSSSWWLGQVVLGEAVQRGCEVLGNIYENPELLKS